MQKCNFSGTSSIKFMNNSLNIDVCVVMNVKKSQTRKTSFRHVKILRRRRPLNNLSAVAADTGIVRSTFTIV